MPPDRPGGDPEGTSPGPIFDRDGEIESTLAGVLESVPDAIVIVDADGRMVLVNSQAEALFGYPRSELLGRAVEILVPERFHSHSARRGMFFEAPSRRPMGVGLDLYGRRKDGSEFPVEISLSTFRMEGRLLAMSAIRDVTDRRQMEAARATAEAAVRLRDEFLSVAAHELRTPITAVKGYAQLLQRAFAPGRPLDAERVGHALDVLVGQTNKLVRLIDQLLDVARVQAQRLDLMREPADVGAIVRMTVDVVAASVRGRQEFRVQAPEGIVAEVDALRLEQVLFNLLDNAVKFGLGGGVTEVTVERAGGQVAITIRDHGPGIPPEEHRHIFERFYQGKSHSQTAGMGVGLWISREIVNLHGGSLTVETPEEGPGVQFVVVLPLG